MRQLVFEDQMPNPFDFKLPLSAIFVKYSIFLFNLVAFICGLILLGISCSTAVAYSAGQPLENIYDEKYASLPIFIGITGVFLSGLCFVGCWGAMKESWGMLMGYAISLIIVCLCLFIGGICGYVYSDTVEETVEKMAHNSINQWCPDGPTDFAWESIQESYQCCGVNSYKDWANNKNYKYWRTGQAVLDAKMNVSDLRPYPVPDSCCGKENCGLESKTEPYTKGCLEAIEHNLEDNLAKIAGAAVGISVFEIIVICLSFFLARHFAKKDEFYKTMA